MLKRPVDCPTHGQTEAAFICGHLAGSLKTGEKVGFFYPDEPLEYSEAWCSSCEDVRIAEGGETGEWTDESEDFAQITFVCSGCYDHIRELNTESPTVWQRLRKLIG